MIHRVFLLLLITIFLPQFLTAQRAAIPLYFADKPLVLPDKTYTPNQLLTRGENTILSGSPFSDSGTDTMTVRKPGDNFYQNQMSHPQWGRGAIVPAALIIAGTATLIPPSHCLLSKYTIHDKVLNLFSGAASSVDNYLQYAPLALTYGLKSAGVKSRSNFINQLVITAKAKLLMSIIVRGMKSGIPSERPSGTMHSMPSGHTAQAFVSATILDMEYRDTSPWISLAGYTMAAGTGLYRIINNKHWISDVLIGAGIGIFSTKAVYFTHRYQWGKRKNVVLLPTLYNRGGGATLAWVL